MLDIIFKKENGLPHISTTLQCEIFAQVRGSQWRQRRTERMRVNRDKSIGARAQNRTVNEAHGCMMHVCGPKNPHINGTRPRMKNPNGFLSIQLGIGWLAGRLRPVSAPAS
jgi:hypothetical protein